VPNKAKEKNCSGLLKKETSVMREAITIQIFMQALEVFKRKMATIK
jgi:hypothetical protein